jgi:predicted transcriptional regulator
MREELGLTRSDLARQAGVNRAYLSRVERGERQPSAHWLRAVTDALAAAAAKEAS